MDIFLAVESNTILSYLSDTEATYNVESARRCHIYISWFLTCEHYQ
jgi:hypothetical protein